MNPTSQDPKQKFLFDPFPDMPFGPEVERQRIEAEKAEAKRKTLVSKMRQEIAAFQARHNRCVGVTQETINDHTQEVSNK